MVAETDEIEPREIKPRLGRALEIHPLIVRITHAVNAFAIICMILSGWRIYNASPFFGFSFPNWMTLGGWLAGALAWHFAIMWLLVVNGIVYLVYSLSTGHFRHHFLPISSRAVWSDLKAAFAFKLAHVPDVYNAVQRLLYFGVIALGVLIVLSGVAIWKPVQFQWLTALFAGYEGARRVHFVCMAGIVAFLVVHIVLVALVPRTLASITIGHRRARKPEKAESRAEHQP